MNCTFLAPGPRFLRSLPAASRQQHGSSAVSLVRETDGTSGLPVQASQNPKLLWCVGFENATLWGSRALASQACLNWACVLFHLHDCNFCCVCPYAFSWNVSRGWVLAVLGAACSLRAPSLPYCALSWSTLRPAAPLPTLVLVSVLLQEAAIPAGFCSLRSGLWPKPPAHLCQWPRHVKDVTI